MKQLPHTQTKTDRSKVISLEKGKIPPQATDIEVVVLGAMLIDAKGPPEAIQIIGKESVFYKSSHQLVYNAMVELFEDSEPIDLLTVSKKLKESNDLDNAGGDFFLISLSQAAASSAHIDFHCRILMQMFVKRESIKMASHIIESAYQPDKDIFDLLSESHRAIDDVSTWLMRKQAVDFKAVSDSIFEESTSKDPGVPSKLSKLQKMFNGYQDPDMIIVAARPGMGKTAFFLNEAKSQAQQGIPVGVFSLEMSAKQLGERMLAEMCGIDANKIKNKTTIPEEKEIMQSKRAEFEKLPIYINDQGALTPMEMRLEAGKWVRDHGVKMIYIDYLQLMNDGGKVKSGNREQEISFISSSIKACAKELEIPIMALAQLSRAVENRGGMKRPLLSDLRESGSIEQDADIVIFMLRPEYYKIWEWDDDSRSSTKGQCELIISKYRGGELFSTIVKTDLRYMRFTDLDQDDMKDWEDDNPFIDREPIEPQDAFETANNAKELPEEDINDLPF